MADDNENDLFHILRLCGFADVVDLLRAQQAEIERLRAVLDAVDALACSVDRPDDAVDYWVTGYADAMQKVKALLHPEEARHG